jgi:hypothetical protein
MPAKTTRKRRYTPLTPEQRAERIATARAQLNAGVEALMSGEGWQQFVASRRWLRRYSLGNQIMIMAQCPEATDVRPLSEWNAAGYRMRTGTHQIKIWKPVTRSSAPAKAEATGEDGVDEAKAPVEARRRRAPFILVNVVDRSQLDNPPPAPEVALPAALSGDAPAGLWVSVAALIEAEGFTVERGPCDRGAFGTTDLAARTVRVRDDVEPAQAAKTLTHELAHVLMGHDGSMPGQVREVEAESVACLVTAALGLDSLAYSVPYVAGWAGNIAAVRTSAERVIATADLILAALGTEGGHQGDEQSEAAA